MMDHTYSLAYAKPSLLLRDKSYLVWWMIPWCMIGFCWPLSSWVSLCFFPSGILVCSSDSLLCLYVGLGLRWFWLRCNSWEGRAPFGLICRTCRELVQIFLHLLEFSSEAVRAWAFLCCGGFKYRFNLYLGCRSMEISNYLMIQFW